MALAKAHTLSADEALETIAERGEGRWAFICVAILSINSTVQALETNLLPYLGNCAAAEFKTGALSVSTLFSSVFVGLIIGALVFSPMADVVGRRSVLVWTTWLLFIFGVLSAVAPSFEVLLVLRVLVGVMEGAWTVSLDLLAEFVPAERRGYLLNLSNLGWGLGSAYVALLAWLIIPSMGWRVYVAVASLPMGISAVMVMYMEESPRWLVLEGRTHEAYEALKRIAAIERCEVPCAALLDQRGDDEHSRLADRGASPGCGSGRILRNLCGLLREYVMVCQGERGKMTFLVCSIWACWGFTYSGIVFYNSAVLGSSEGLDVCSFDYPLTIMLSCAEVAGTVVIMPLIDSQGGGIVGGRKGVQIVPFFGCAITTFLVGVAAPPLAPLVAFMSRSLICAASSGAVVQVAELFDTKVRATATGLASIVGNVTGVLASYWVLAPMSQATVVSVFAATSLLASMLACFLPETAQTALAV